MFNSKSLGAALICFIALSGHARADDLTLECHATFNPKGYEVTKVVIWIDTQSGTATSTFGNFATMSDPATASAKVTESSIDFVISPANGQVFHINRLSGNATGWGDSTYACTKSTQPKPAPKF